MMSNEEYRAVPTLSARTPRETKGLNYEPPAESRAWSQRQYGGN